MKFQFEGYQYSEGKEHIEIDFDFMEKSEFIRVLEPDLTIPIMIPERFSNYQIDEFKIMLEKITNKEEITEEDKYLCKSKVLKPLFEYFRIDKEVMDLRNKSIVNVKSIRKNQEINLIEINFTLGNFVCEFHSKLLVRKKRKICNYFLLEQWMEDDKWHKYFVNIDELTDLKNNLEKKLRGSVLIPIDDDDDEDGHFIISTKDGKLFLDIYEIGYDNINIKYEIMDPINFLDSFYTQLKNQVFEWKII